MVSRKMKGCGGAGLAIALIASTTLLGEPVQLPTREIERSQIIPLHSFMLPISSEIAVPLTAAWKRPGTDAASFGLQFVLPSFPSYSPVAGLQFPIWPIPIFARYGLLRNVEQRSGTEILTGPELVINGGINSLGISYSQAKKWQYTVSYGMGMGLKILTGTATWFSARTQATVLNAEALDGDFRAGLGVQLTDKTGILPEAALSVYYPFNPDSGGKHLRYYTLAGVELLSHRSAYHSFRLASGISVSHDGSIDLHIGIGTCWQWHGRRAWETEEAEA